MAFKGILGALALDGLPILTGGQNVPPEGGNFNGLSTVWPLPVLLATIGLRPWCWYRVS